MAGHLGSRSYRLLMLLLPLLYVDASACLIAQITASYGNFFPPTLFRGSGRGQGLCSLRMPPGSISSAHRRYMARTSTLLV